MDATKMTNNEQIEALVVEKTKAWLDGNVSSVSVSQDVSVDLDELLDQKIERREIVALSINVFNAFLQLIQALDSPPLLVMVIPLVSENTKLEASAPENLQQIEAQYSEFESTSVHLLDWDVLKYWNGDEEYKIPLSIPFDGLVDEGIRIYYREFRGRTSIENHWEYSRCIYVSYYPP